MDKGIPHTDSVERVLQDTSRCFSVAFLDQKECIGDISIRRQQGAQEQGERRYIMQEGAPEAEEKRAGQLISFPCF